MKTSSILIGAAVAAFALTTVTGHHAGHGSGHGRLDVAVSHSGYRDPLRGDHGLTFTRIDQGVDYDGTGPVYALGPGIIVNTFNAGWGPPIGEPPGAFIVEDLTSGPLEGRDVYVAEGCDPAVVKGQHVGTGTEICWMTGASIETGFADPRHLGKSMAMASGQANPSNPGLATGFGHAYAGVLHRLGAPTGGRR